MILRTQNNPNYSTLHCFDALYTSLAQCAELVTILDRVAAIVSDQVLKLAEGKLC